VIDVCMSRDIVIKVLSPITPAKAFADDHKMYLCIQSPTDCHLLQSSLVKLPDWARQKSFFFFCALVLLIRSVFYRVINFYRVIKRMYNQF